MLPALREALRTTPEGAPVSLAAPSDARGADATQAFADEAAQLASYPPRDAPRSSASTSVVSLRFDAPWAPPRG